MFVVGFGSGCEICFGGLLLFASFFEYPLFLSIKHTKNTSFFFLSFHPAISILPTVPLPTFCPIIFLIDLSILVCPNSTKAMTTANTNTRASLLAGLRTGGVRSSMDPSHTASPGGTFDLRPPSNYRPTSFSEDTEKFHQNISLDSDVPMAVAVDGPINHFSQHQGTRGMNPNSVPFSPGFAPQAHIQMQMLQLEMMRIQVYSIAFTHIAIGLKCFLGNASSTISGDYGSGDTPAAFTDSRS